MKIAPSTETFLKTSLSLGALSATASTAGYLFGGLAGLSLSISSTMLTTIISYWFSRELTLYAFNAKEVTPHQKYAGFNVHQLVTDLLQNEFKNKNFNKPPKICIVNADSRNAFATGPHKGHCAIAITTGLLQAARAKAKSNEQAEGWIKAILCHEIGHITNRDIATTTVATILVGIVRCSADGYAYLQRSNPKNSIVKGAIPFFLTHFVLSVCSIMLNLCLSRAREFAADDVAATHGYAHLLAESFELLRENDPNDKKPLAMNTLGAMCCSSTHPKYDTSIASNLQSHESPWYTKTSSYIASFFSTHPDLDARIKRMNDYASANMTKRC